MEKMVNDAKKNESVDKEKKEKIDILNQAEHVVYETEKNLKDHGDKLDSKEKNELEQKVADLKKAKDSGNSDDIKSSLEALNTLWSSLASKMVDSNQDNNSQTNTASKKDKNKKESKDSEIEDADFEVVD